MSSSSHHFVFWSPLQQDEQIISQELSIITVIISSPQILSSTLFKHKKVIFLSITSLMFPKTVISHCLHLICCLRSCPLPLKKTKQTKNFIFLVSMTPHSPSFLLPPQLLILSFPFEDFFASTQSLNVRTLQPQPWFLSFNLFTICAHDWSDFLQSCGSKCHLYAHDSKMCISIISSSQTFRCVSTYISFLGML